MILRVLLFVLCSVYSLFFTLVYGPTGNPGRSVSVLGTYDDYQKFIDEHPEGKTNESYLVDGNLYVWSNNDHNWTNAGNIKGPKGAQDLKEFPVHKIFEVKQDQVKLSQ